MDETFLNIGSLYCLDDAYSPHANRAGMLHQTIDGRYKAGALTLTYHGLNANHVPTFTAPNSSNPPRSTKHDADAWRFFEDFDFDLVLEVGRTYHFFVAIDNYHKTKKGKDIRHVLCLISEKPPHVNPRSWSYNNNASANGDIVEHFSYCHEQNKWWLHSLGVTA